MTGQIKTFIGDRGFGFITNDQSNTDIFFHVSAWQAGPSDPPQVGDRVAYIVGEERGRTRALDVYRI